ncbi:transaldolase [Kribbella flavida DSM 17836]|uniref:Transaldolase n=1 Tax=Kribbella flavida (strain DSM 17836 / JCM 10339 / NBRC 14399) TaxID=479435 RepID=D2Q4L8_KRIFD|nr:transaldolase [Kribbella flavida]ADB32332.1 transaldolase [Kribbella flavida DSM 17836]
MTDRLKDLADAGVSIWLDDLSRQRLTSGNLATLIHDQHVSGVTTNPTIFAKAISDKNAYAEQVATLAAENVSTDQAIRVITTDDVRDAADLFKPVYDDTDGVDGRVSIEVEPGLARDTEKTIAQAKELWETVGRENVFIKIPATQAGLSAITETLAAGISVNVTLIFSLERYRAVADAFLSGLEKALDNGHDVTKLGSVASFFVSRVDSEVDKRLDAIGTDEAKALKGKAAIANARLAFEAYEEIFATDRWRALETAGAKPQRPLWASTGVKDPAYKSTMYVEELVTSGVVNTMPAATIEAVAESAEITGDTVRGDYDADRKVIADLEKLGISYDEVVQVLEDEGLSKFDASWSELQETVTAALKAAAK